MNLPPWPQPIITKSFCIYYPLLYDKSPQKQWLKKTFSQLWELSRWLPGSLMQLHSPSWCLGSDDSEVPPHDLSSSQHGRWSLASKRREQKGQVLLKSCLRMPPVHFCHTLLIIAWIPRMGKWTSSLDGNSYEVSVAIFNPLHLSILPSDGLNLQKQHFHMLQSSISWIHHGLDHHCHLVYDTNFLTGAPAFSWVFLTCLSYSSQCDLCKI